MRYLDAAQGWLGLFGLIFLPISAFLWLREQRPRIHAKVKGVKKPLDKPIKME